MEQLKPYHAHKEEMIKINKGKRFQQAVDAVEEFLKKAKGKDQVSGFNFAFCAKVGLDVINNQASVLPLLKLVASSFKLSIEEWS